MCWGHLVAPAHFMCLGVFNCEHCTLVPQLLDFFLREAAAAAAQIPAQLCNGPEIKQISAWKSERNSVGVFHFLTLSLCPVLSHTWYHAIQDTNHEDLSFKVQYVIFDLIYIENKIHVFFYPKSRNYIVAALKIIQKIYDTLTIVITKNKSLYTNKGGQ